MNQELIAMLAEVAGTSAEDIRGGFRLGDDLNMSAAEVDAVIVLIEDEMGVSVSDYDADEMLDMTVREFCNTVLAED